MSIQKNKPGQKFGLLTLERRHQRRRGGYTWIFKCYCGDRLVASVRDVRSGHTKSCGCQSAQWKAIKATTHGQTYSREYSSWYHMKGRCYAKNDPKYPLYGGRGIYVCERWRKSFAAFLSDMGKCQPGLTLDRVETDGNYEPGNCRWATKKTQSTNRRMVRRVVLNGEDVACVDAERALGVGYNSIRQRARDFGETLQWATDHFARKKGIAA